MDNGKLTRRSAIITTSAGLAAFAATNATATENERSDHEIEYKDNQEFFDIDDQKDLDEDGQLNWFDFDHNSLDDIPKLAGEEQLAAQGRQRHPELNSKLLITPPGSVFLVIDGVALGYRSDTIFRRIHYRCFSRWVGTNPRVRVRICPRFHRVQSVNWITVGYMDTNCQLRRNPDQPGAVFLIRSGFKHGITSRAAFENYQFDYDDIGGVMLREEWNALRNGVLLRERTGGRFDP